MEVLNSVFGSFWHEPQWSPSVGVKGIDGSTASPAVCKASVQDEANSANQKDGAEDSLGSRKQSIVIGIVHAD